MQRARLRALAGAGGALLLGAAALWGGASSMGLSGRPGVSLARGPAAAASGQPAPVIDPVAWLQADPSRPRRSLAEVEHALFREGSLRGVSPDGGFHLDLQGHLLPEHAVRRRFDQVLSTLGEATIEELTALIEAQAGRELPSSAGVAQVMDLWNRYLDLQRHPFVQHASPLTAEGWRPALEERMRVRREKLGLEWADAFYGEEEAALRARMERQTGEAAPTDTTAVAAAAPAQLPDAARAPRPGEDLAALQREREAALGVEAAQRLKALDEEEARWARRLGQAQQQLGQLQKAPELSALQRQQAIERLLDEQFQPEERLRARALLGLGTAGV